jgi:ADP-heptose:LPS heptosyltransferase
MGDVALTLPVLTAIRKQHPEIEIVFLTRKQFFPFFRSVEGLILFEADFNGRHKGLAGLLRLEKDIREKYVIDYIVDLHNVTRSKVLRLLFSLSGVGSAVIDKGRTEKRRLIAGLQQESLPHSVDRYFKVFSDAGVSLLPAVGPYIRQAGSFSNDRGCLLIGVAPYAKHELKVWPEDYMVKLLNMISEGREVHYLLFGGREDVENLKKFAMKVNSSEVVAGIYTLDEELDIICNLDAMIAMDSSNMHMAALAGVKTISIWGGTDPSAGFGAWDQPDGNMIRISRDELKCRPCTIYGKGTCKRGDFACMKWLTPEVVYEKLVNLKII